MAQTGADSLTQIKGVVLDSINRQPQAYATIRVLKQDSARTDYRAFTANENGIFSFSLPYPQQYILVFSSSEAAFSRELNLSDEQPVDLGEVHLINSSHVLDEISVSAAKPLVKFSMDRVAYSIEDDPESRTSNLLEMLRKVPLLSVDGDDKIRLKGGTKFKILMDGKPTNFSEDDLKNILKSTQANTIKEIEVITDPGAKYDADGLDGVINIVTVSNSKLGGYSLTLSSGVDQRGSINGNASLQLQQGKWGVILSGGLGEYKSLNSHSDSYREIFDQLDSQGNIIPNPYKYLESDEKNTYKGNSSNFRGKITYEIDTLQLLSLSGNGYLGGSDFTSSGQTQMSATDRTPTQHYQTNSSGKNKYGNISANFDYQLTSAKEKERLLTVSYQFNYSPLSNENIYKIDSLLNYHNYNGKNFSQGGMIAHTAQIDFTTPIKEVHVVEAGAKYTLRSNKTESEYYKHDKLAGDSTQHDRYNNQQDILGVYLSYRYTVEKWSFRAGGRLEYTSQQARFPLEEAKNFSKTYPNLIPSVSITFKPTDMQTLRATYTMGLWRPGIWQLNPFNSSVDSNFVSTGNPNLGVEHNQSFGISYDIATGKVYLSTSLSYYFSRNSIEHFSEMRNNISYSTYYNTGEYDVAGLYAYLSWNPSSKVSLYANLGGHYARMATGGTNSQENSGFQMSFYGGGSYTMPWKIRLSGYGGYQSPNINAQGSNSQYYYYGVSLSRSFFKKDALTVRLSANMPFLSERRYSSETRTPSYLWHSNYFDNSSLFGINVSLRLGDMSVQIKETERTISSDDLKSGDSGASGGGRAQGGR
jgi:outer membrane receptor protein involved in Fe transport